LKKVEETGSSRPEVPTVPIKKKVDQTEKFLTVGETHARNWVPHAALFEWNPVPIECQLSANKCQLNSVFELFPCIPVH
jgi:hypothetical protein